MPTLRFGIWPFRFVAISFLAVSVYDQKPRMIVIVYQIKRNYPECSTFRFGLKLKKTFKYV